MQTRIIAVQIIHLGLLDRLNHVLRDQFYIMVYACQIFGCIQYQCGARPQQSCSLGGYDGSIRQLHCSSGNSGLLLTFLGGHCSAA